MPPHGSIEIGEDVLNFLQKPIRFEIKTPYVRATPQTAIGRGHVPSRPRRARASKHSRVLNSREVSAGCTDASREFVVGLQQRPGTTKANGTTQSDRENAWREEAKKDQRRIQELEAQVILGFFLAFIQTQTLTLTSTRHSTLTPTPTLTLGRHAHES